MPYRHNSSKDSAFEKRQLILERDDHTCRFCGFRSAPNKDGVSYQEILTLDHDLGNNANSNLATCCTFCYTAHHIGYAGMMDSAVMIYLPEIPQVYLSHLSRAILVASMDENDFTGSAQAIQSSLESRALYLEEVFGPGSSDPVIFGQAILNSEPSQINRKALEGIRILPFPGSHTELGEFLRNGAFSKVPVASWGNIATPIDYEAIIRESRGISANDALSGSDVNHSNYVEHLADSSNANNDSVQNDSHVYQDPFLGSQDDMSMLAAGAVAAAVVTEQNDGIDSITDNAMYSGNQESTNDDAQATAYLDGTSSESHDSYQDADVMTNQPLVENEAAAYALVGAVHEYIATSERQTASDAEAVQTMEPESAIDNAYNSDNNAISDNNQVQVESEVKTEDNSWQPTNETVFLDEFTDSVKTDSHQEVMNDEALPGLSDDDFVVDKPRVVGSDALDVQDASADHYREPVNDFGVMPPGAFGAIDFTEVTEVVVNADEIDAGHSGVIEPTNPVDGDSADVDSLMNIDLAAFEKQSDDESEQRDGK